MTDKNIGERAEHRRNRLVAVLFALSIAAAALQIISALLAKNGASTPWLTVLSATAVAGFMFAMFRLGDRISDEFKQRQVAFVAITMMKALFIFYPAWLVLQHGGLLPELDAIELFAGQVAVMFLSLIWCRIRG